MNIKITVIKDFGRKPYGRYQDQGEFSGERFRKEVLAPKLKQASSTGVKVEVILDGYNRYGRSFIDEAFGGLIREEGFSSAQLHNLLEIVHSDAPSIASLAWERIEKASQE